MAGDQDNRKDDDVFSEKIINSESEKVESFSLDEKHAQEYRKSQLSDSKDRKLDAEHQLDPYLMDQDELDIAIINEVTVTEDDVNMKCLTFRAMLVGIVSIKTSHLSVRMSINY